MRYVHVRNIEKYQMGYKDRRHIWAKIYGCMIDGDEDAELLNEVSWSRLVKFIVLETTRQKPTPLDRVFLVRRGFDYGIETIETTLKNLSHFIEVIDVTENENPDNKMLRREEEKREEKNREDESREDERELGKKQFGNDGLVSLTLEQHEKLIARFGEKKTGEYIDRLNNYIASKGKRYRSHYHTILTWVDKDGTGQTRADAKQTARREKLLREIGEIRDGH
jgi:hypothetical protein